MPDSDLNPLSTQSENEERALRTRLRSTLDEIRSSPRSTSVQYHKIDALDRQVRQIVLRLVELEREQIELEVAKSL